MSFEFEYDEIEVTVGEKTYFVSGTYEADYVDNGIGGYEYWGARGVHHDWQWELEDFSMEVTDEEDNVVTDKEVLSKVSSLVTDALNSLLDDKPEPDRE